MIQLTIMLHNFPLMTLFDWASEGTVETYSTDVTSLHMTLSRINEKYLIFFSNSYSICSTVLLYEPHREKTGLQGF